MSTGPRGMGLGPGKKCLGPTSQQGPLPHLKPSAVATWMRRGGAERGEWIGQLQKGGRV